MRNTRIRSALLLHVALACTSVLSQDLDPVQIGLWPRFAGGGEVNSVAVQDDHAYCTVGNVNGCGGNGSLVIFDVSDLKTIPTEPEPVGWYHFEDGAPSTIRVSGDHAYVVVALELCADRVRVFDVHDPTVPRPVGDDHHLPPDFSIAGDYLYVIERDPDSDNSALTVLDARDPSGLREVTRVVDVVSPSRVLVAGNHAYVSSASPPDLVVLDVSDPTRPLRVGTLEGAGGVYAVGDSVALAAAEPTPGGVCGMKVIDVRDPRNPRLVETLSVGCDGARPGTIAAGDKLFLGLSIYDASDPADLRPLGVVDVKPSGVHALFPTPERVYLAQPEGLSVFDVSELEYRARLGGWVTRDTVSLVAASGDYVYVAGGDAFDPGGRNTSLHVLDVSDPAAPRRVGGLRGFPDLGNFVARSVDLVLSGDHLYMAGAGGLYVVEVTDRAAPKLVAGVAASGEVLSLSVSQGHAYLAGFAGLDVLDVRVPTRPALLGHNDEFARDVFVSGPRAYVAGNSELTVFDVSDPSAPRRLGSCDCRGAAVAVSGSYAYASYDGLVVVDVSDPSNPSPVGSLNVVGTAEDIVVSGDRAWIAFGGEGVKVVDVSDPKSPSVIEEYPSFGASEDLAVSGGLVFFADRYSALDVIDPGVPVEPIPRMGRIESSLSISDVVVSGSNAYVVDDAARLHLFDVADPALPRRVARHEDLRSAERSPSREYRNRVFVSGETVYVIDHYQRDRTVLAVFDVSDPQSAQRIATHDLGFKSQISCVEDGYAYFGQYHFDQQGGARLSVLNLRDPTAPRHVGDYVTTGTTGLLHGLSVSGSYAYLSVEGLEVVDVSEPAMPRLARSYRDISSPAVVSQGYLYAGYSGVDGEGLQIFDASDPTNLQLRGRYLAGGVARIQLVSGDYAYIDDSSPNRRRAEFQMIDVGDPTAPQLVGRYFGSGALFAAGAHVYGTQPGGLQIIDASPLADPQRVGGHELTLSPEGWRVGIVDVAVEGDLAYVAHGANGLFVFDVSRPDRPRHVTRYETIGEPQGVFVAGRNAYVADGSAGLEVLDVSDPARPSRLGGLDTEGYAEGVFVEGDVAYVADWTSGLQIIDVSDSTAPRRVGGFDEGFGQGIGLAHGVVVSDDHAYVAAGSSGLHVFAVSDPTSPRRSGIYGAHALEVALQGSYVYVTYGDGLVVLDSSNPTNLELVGRYPFGSASRFAVSGDYAYVLAREILHVVDLSDPAAPRRVGRNSSLQFGLAAAVAGDTLFVAEPDRFSVFALSRPFPPTGVAALAGDGEVKLSWSAPSGGRSPTGYDVYRVAPGPRVRLNARPVTGISFPISGLENGLEHCFAVQSVGASGERSIDSAPLACAVPVAPMPRFLRGDCNDDGNVDISDAISTLGALFLGQREITCEDACDSNDDGGVNISDPIATLGVLFLGQGDIPLPGVKDCGGDPTDDGLGCEQPSDQCR